MNASPAWGQPSPGTAGTAPSPSIRASIERLASGVAIGAGAGAGFGAAFDADRYPLVLVYRAP
jgi:hypothetical protein